MTPPNKPSPSVDAAKAMVPAWRQNIEHAANATIIALSGGFLSARTLERLRKALEDAPPSLFTGENHEHD